MVKRVVIDPEGRIIRIELKPPFDYLDPLAKGGQNGKRGKGSSAGTKRTSTQAGSLHITQSDPSRIRHHIYDTPDALTWATAYLLNRLHNTVKVTRDDEIRERYANGERISDLARAFDLTPARIWQIVNFKTH